MVAHDAWFYSVHRLFHEVRQCPDTCSTAVLPVLVVNCFLTRFAPVQVKPLFKLVHQQHHRLGSNVTALGTAYGDAADVGMCFVMFHGLLGASLWLLPRWNLVGVVVLIAFEARPEPSRMTLPVLWRCE